jgi:hypothetical protein
MAAITVFLAGVACSSYAQFGGGGGGMGGGGGGRQRGGQAPAAGQAPQRTQNRWEQVSLKLYDLRIQLLITSEQGPAWENFRGRFLDVATAGSLSHPVADEQTAKDAFQQLLGDAQKRANALGMLDAAAQALLAQLSPDQLQTVNKELPALLAEFGGSPTAKPRQQ